MSDGDQQPTPTNLLEGLSFAPDWAKGSSDSHYTHLNKYAARFDAVPVDWEGLRTFDVPLEPVRSSRKVFSFKRSKRILAAAAVAAVLALLGAVLLGRSPSSEGMPETVRMPLGNGIDLEMVRCPGVAPGEPQDRGGSRGESATSDSALKPGGKAKTTWYVDAARGRDEHDGLSRTAAKKTIQNALDCATDGDEIVVAVGVYKENASSTCGLSNGDGKNVSIRSEGGPLVTFIDGEGLRRVVKGTAASTQDMWKSHALTLDGFTIRNGYHNGASAAAWCNLKNCIVRENVAAHSAIVTSVHLDNCLIVGNTVSNHLQKANSTLIDKMKMVNCTVSGNRLENGSGCHAFAIGSVDSSIIFGNDIGGGLLFADSATASHSCIQSETGGNGNIVADPRFVNAANGDFRLASDSPCIDAGAAGFSDLPFDLDGNPRVNGRAVDMGCYESTPRRSVTIAGVSFHLVWCPPGSFTMGFIHSS